MTTARIEIGISLGSNIGDRAATLIAAVDLLTAYPGWVWSDFSSIYETEPVEVSARFQDQVYFNAVAVGLLAKPELALFSDELHRIEAVMGRVRGPERNAPRPLDLDLIYAGTLVLDTPALRIPHPRWTERRFVVEPLAEIRPDLRLPGPPKTVSEILHDLSVRPAVRRLTIPGWPPPGTERHIHFRDAASRK
jgi:2-amino-4-hydroxy-6-hydroxymethyldihydropteridine diphosphokinase